MSSSSSTEVTYESKTSVNEWWVKDADAMIDAVKACTNIWYPGVEVVGTTSQSEYKQFFKLNMAQWLFSAELTFELKAPCCLKGNSKCECKAMEKGIDHFAFQCKPSDILSSTIRDIIHKGRLKKEGDDPLKALTKILCYGTIEDDGARTGRAMVAFYY